MNPRAVALPALLASAGLVLFGLVWLALAGVLYRATRPDRRPSKVDR